MGAPRKPRPPAPAGARGSPPAPAQAQLPAANEPITDEARKGIDKISTQLTEFDKVDAGLTALEAKYSNVAYAVETAEGYADAKAARKDIQTPRFAVEHIRKAAKEPVLALGRNIDARAETIKARLLAIEKPIDDQITAQDNRERDRKAGLAKRIEEIRNTPTLAIGKPLVELEQILEGLNTLPLVEFQELREEAAAAQAWATVKVTTLLQAARDAEALRVQQEAERADAGRKDAIKAKITAITGLLTTAQMCRTSDRLQQLVTRLEGMKPDESFQEFLPQATQDYTDVLTHLQALLEEKKASEAQATQLLEREAAMAQREAALADRERAAAPQVPIEEVKNQQARDRIEMVAAMPPVPPIASIGVVQPDGEIIPHAATEWIYGGGRGGAGKHGVWTSAASWSPPARKYQSTAAMDRPGDLEILQALISIYDEPDLTVLSWLQDMRLDTVIKEATP